ncbi:MAG: PqqD family protein [Clostridiales bacterium]|nr:PqqD family protein [Clostridiales bacterium]
MKLKNDFVTQTIDDTQFLVAVGGKTFNGIVRSNPTAAFIVDMLREGTTKEEIVDAMCEKYDAPREVISKDVDKVLDTLRGIDAIEE